MKALLIIAHGSRSEAANDEIVRLAGSIRARTAGSFGEVRHAFLELTSPAVEDAVRMLAQEGAGEILVFPYFLVDGSHTASDIPRLVDEAREAHPDIDFSILPYLGSLDGISELIARQIPG